MDRNTIEQAWFDFADKYSSDDHTVVFSDQVTGSQAPRPRAPFITLKLISGPLTKNFDDLQFDSDPNPAGEFAKWNLGGMRQRTISIQAFGEASEDTLACFQSLLDAPGVVQEFKTKGDIAIVSRGNVLDVSAAVDTGFERRHSLDIIFNSSKNIKVDIGVIEKVEVGGTLNKCDATSITVEPKIIPDP